MARSATGIILPMAVCSESELKELDTTDKEPDTTDILRTIRTSYGHSRHPSFAIVRRILQNRALEHGSGHNWCPHSPGWV